MNGSQDEAGLSREGILSRRHPAAARFVADIPEYQQWLGSLPKVDVDGTRYYVRGGDMLKDGDEVLWEWARRNRPDLVPEAQD